MTKQKVQQREPMDARAAARRYLNAYGDGNDWRGQKYYHPPAEDTEHTQGNSVLRLKVTVDPITGGYTYKRM